MSAKTKHIQPHTRSYTHTYEQILDICIDGHGYGRRSKREPESKSIQLSKREVGLMSSKRPVGLAWVGPLEEGERGAPRIKAALIAA